MAFESTKPKLARVNESALLDAATKAIPAEFPNPERTGCPEASTLEAIAARRLSVLDIDDLVDHIATCSPCFTAYDVYRKEYCSRRNRRCCVTGAALVIVLAASYCGFRVLSPTVPPPVPIAKIEPLNVVLDFHDRTAERSSQVHGGAPPDTPHLRRSLINLQIQLPLGEEDGPYSLELRDRSGAVITRTAGIAQWNGAAEALSARIDLRTVDPGPYTLAVRKGASSWRRYSLIVD